MGHADETGLGCDSGTLRHRPGRAECGDRPGLDARRPPARVPAPNSLYADSATLTRISADKNLTDVVNAIPDTPVIPGERRQTRGGPVRLDDLS
ncbi:hypothetical protein ACU686_19985 [Yinghuangia aomiensis]